jgi:hypothetical protein
MMANLVSVMTFVSKWLNLVNLEAKMLKTTLIVLSFFKLHFQLQVVDIKIKLKIVIELKFNLKNRSE